MQKKTLTFDNLVDSQTGKKVTLEVPSNYPDVKNHPTFISGHKAAQKFNETFAKTAE